MKKLLVVLFKLNLRPKIHFQYNINDINTKSNVIKSGSILCRKDLLIQIDIKGRNKKKYRGIMKTQIYGLDEYLRMTQSCITKHTTF